MTNDCKGEDNYAPFQSIEKTNIDLSLLVFG